MGSEAVVAEGLTKIFITKERKGFLKKGRAKKVVAVDHVSFRIRRGEVFGLLGPNGAGKTTTVKMLSTLLIPDEGEAWVNGFHIVKEADKVRENIGVSLYSDRGFYWKLTGRENLRFFAYLHHIPPREAEERINRLLDLVGLSNEADKLVEEYSTGMKSKLNFARALLNDPPILFLDEPTIGLDPGSARQVREIIGRLRHEGRAVLLTTHNMAEAEALCDHVAIMNEGKIVAMGTVEELRRLVKKRNVLILEAANIHDGVLDRLRVIEGVSYVSGRIEDPVGMRGVVRVGLDGDSRDYLPEIIRVLTSYGVRIVYVKPSEPSLEDVFIELTGRGFYEEG